MSARFPARLIAVVVLLAAVTLGVAPASACVVIVDPYRTSSWERLWDWKPPRRAAAPSIRIKRGVGPVVYEDGSSSSSSCDDIGFISLTFPAASSDERVGYAFEVLEGEAPDGLLPDGPLRTMRRRDGTHGLTLSWIDGATDDQEAFSFVLGIRTVDWAGNRSREVTRVLVQDPGR